MSRIAGEHQYLAALRDVLDNGDHRIGRNGGVRSLFGRQMRFDMADGFPLLTTKKVHWKSIAVELLWFLRGESNTRFLKDHGVTIWDEWEDADGELGPVYGVQWRSWTDHEAPEGRYIDQIANVIESLRNDPYGRRHIVTAWNPALIDQMALPPCHMMFQFHVGGDGRLNMQLYQRSADMFLGVPFNIASYALLLHLIAREIGREAGVFVHTLGDYHLYDNHVEQAKLQLSREIRRLPSLDLPSISSCALADIQWTDCVILGYTPHDRIKADVSA